MSATGKSLRRRPMCAARDCEMWPRCNWRPNQDGSMRFLADARTAQWVSSDGTQLHVATDVMWDQHGDSYSVVIKNRLVNGTLNIVGAAHFEAINGNNDTDLCSVDRLYC